MTEPADVQFDSRGDGPTGCPWHASYDPLSVNELTDPQPSFAFARRNRPVFLSEHLGYWSVANRAGAISVLRDKQNFSNAMAMPVPPVPALVAHRLPIYDGVAKFPSAISVLMKDDPEHRPQRALLQTPFTVKTIDDRRSIIDRFSAQFLDQAAAEHPTDLVNSYAIPLALNVICDLVGLPEDKRRNIQNSVEANLQLVSGSLTDSEAINLAAVKVAEYWETIYALAESRMVEPKDDFTSVMAQTRKTDGSMPDARDIAENIHSIIGPGFETSAQLLTQGIWAILSRPDQLDLLRSDPTLMTGALNEIVRHTALVKRVFRLAVNDVEIEGVVIPAGSVVAVLLPSANRDEEYYDDADSFDIRRTKDNLGFGRGQHTCVGMQLALMEMRVTLGNIVERFPNAVVVQAPSEYRRDVRIRAADHCLIDLEPAGR